MTHGFPSLLGVRYRTCEPPTPAATQRETQLRLCPGPSRPQVCPWTILSLNDSTVAVDAPQRFAAAAVASLPCVGACCFATQAWAASRPRRAAGERLWRRRLRSILTWSVSETRVDAALVGREAVSPFTCARRARRGRAQHARGAVRRGVRTLRQRSRMASLAPPSETRQPIPDPLPGWMLQRGELAAAPSSTRMRDNLVADRWTRPN